MYPYQNQYSNVLSGQQPYTNPLPGQVQTGVAPRQFQPMQQQPVQPQPIGAQTQFQPQQPMAGTPVQLSQMAGTGQHMAGTGAWQQGTFDASDPLQAKWARLSQTHAPNYMPAAEQLSSQYGVNPWINTSLGDSYFLKSVDNGVASYVSPATGKVERMNVGGADAPAWASNLGMAPGVANGQPTGAISPQPGGGTGTSYSSALAGTQAGTPDMSGVAALPQSGQNALSTLTYKGYSPDQIGQISAGQNPFPDDPMKTHFNPDGTPQTGLLGAENALATGYNTATDTVRAGVGQAANTLSGFTGQGGQAYDYQAALSGALGNAAQQQAYNQYQESPGYQYLLSEGQDAIKNAASATGGLQGGNVLRELQRHAMGLAAQDFDANFNRLGSLADKGFDASRTVGVLQAGAGSQLGNFAYGTGGQMADNRTQAGRDISANIGGTTSSLAELQTGSGNDLAALLGAQGTNLANLARELGINEAQLLQQLGITAANASQGQASQATSLPALGQFDTPWDAQESLGKLTQSIGNAAAAYGS